MSRYSIHPVEQIFQDWNNERRDRRNQVWAMLRAANSDYIEYELGPYGEPNDSSFKYFMERKWGVRLNYTGGGYMSDSYQIIDEAKHTLFLLKYGK